MVTEWPGASRDARPCREGRMNQDMIGRVPLFASLPRHEIEYLVRTLRPRELPENTLLFREGTFGDLFYILLEGQVEIIKSLDMESERLLGVRVEGSLLGEMSLFSRDGLRTASVRARTLLRVLEMTRADLMLCCIASLRWLMIWCGS